VITASPHPRSLLLPIPLGSGKDEAIQRGSEGERERGRERGREGGRERETRRGCADSQNRDIPSPQHLHVFPATSAPVDFLSAAAAPRPLRSRARALERPQPRSDHIGIPNRVNFEGPAPPRIFGDERVEVHEELLNVRRERKRVNRRRHHGVVDLPHAVRLQHVFSTSSIRLQYVFNM